MKVTIEIGKKEWQQLVPPIDPSLGELTWRLDDNLTLVGVVGSIDAISPPSIVAPPPSPLPVPSAPPVIIQPGHEIQSEPPKRADGKATMFAREWNGALDQADNGIGFFTDPATGKPFDTRNESLHGASLPREILLSTFGISDAWRMPELSDDHTSEIWSKHAAAVRQYALNHKVTVNIDCNGLSARDVILTDAGPLAIGKNGATIGNLIDLTYWTARALNTKGNAKVSIEVLVDGKIVDIQGWDNVKGRVTA